MDQVRNRLCPTVTWKFVCQLHFNVENEEINMWSYAKRFCNLHLCNKWPCNWTSQCNLGQNIILILIQFSSAHHNVLCNMTWRTMKTQLWAWLFSKSQNFLHRPQFINSEIGFITIKAFQCKSKLKVDSKAGSYNAKHQTVKSYLMPDIFHHFEWHRESQLLNMCSIWTYKFE